MTNKKNILALSIIFLVLLIDQVIKIWVKTHMSLGQEIKMFGLDRALIHFVENEGMAFGWKLEIGEQQNYDYGKLLLSLFRIGAVGFLIYYIRSLIQSKVNNGLIACFSLILAGALGNIIDSAFYGLIFSESSYHTENIALLFPPEGGYGTFLHGKVVDMFYFPMFEGVFPAWVPLWGGEPYQFFRPVFNFADAAISVGVVSLILFQRAFFNEDEKVQPVVNVSETITEDISNENDNIEEIDVNISQAI
jgi:signal peptidase II